MNYKNALQTLRAKMQENSNGVVAPEVKNSPFIPSRNTPPVQQDTTEDLLSKGASWLSDIQKAALEIKSHYEKQQSKQPVVSGAEKVVKAVSDATSAVNDAKARKEAFIVRRSEASPSQYAPTRSFEPTIPLDANVSNVLDAIAAVESRGSGDYKAMGPVVTTGTYKGQRALGRYQVMEGNVAAWTKAALGKELSPSEFMASPEAQDAVAAHQLQKAKNKHGTWEDAASVWFSGRPLSKAGNSSDGYVTTPEYVAKFQRNFARPT